MTPAVSSRAPTDDPALTTARSQVDRAARSARSSAAASSGTMPRRSGVPPPPVTSAASAMAVASRTWPGSNTPGRGRHDLVAGGEDGHGGPDPDPDLADPRRCQQPQVLGAKRSPRRREPRARRHVLVGPHQPVAGCGRAHDLDGAGHHRLRVLDHDDGVGAGWEGAPGGDRDGGARPDRVSGTRPMRTAPTTSR